MIFNVPAFGFGALIGLICTGGLFLGVALLFSLVEQQTRDPNHFSRNQRLVRYVVATALIMGQLALGVALLYRNPHFLRFTLSWAAGLIVEILAFSLGLFVITNRRT